MQRELIMRKEEVQQKTIETIYFGGGTPSILSVAQISQLMDTVQAHFELSDDIEITLEANPDDLSPQYIEDLAKTSINRLSIGIQSFHQPDLDLMNRAHNAYEAHEAIKNAQQLGFHNISIDLIYGTPTADFNIWKENLSMIAELGIPHISAYALTVEPKTALENWVSRQKINSPKDEEQHEQFTYMIDFLEKKGYQQYEISNFSRENFHSKHNSSYWKYKPYVGIGPSAHSFDGKHCRSWNISNNHLYMSDIKNEKLPITREFLSPSEAYNEMLMIGLRTIYGVDILEIERLFSKEIIFHFRKKMEEKIQYKELILEGNILKIPKEKWFYADGIASDMFYVY